MLDNARNILVQVEQTSRVVREAGGAESSHLRVGFPEYANHTRVADVLQAFRRRYPYVELEEYEMFTLQQTLQQVDDLREGRLDVGFMLGPVDEEALKTEHVLDIELVTTLPEEHPLAGRDELTMNELSGERLILFSRKFHPRSYDYVVGCCREAGFEPDVVQRKEPQLYSGSTTYRMVASGLGIGIVARSVVSGARPSGVVFKPLREPAPVLELAAAWRKGDLSPNLQYFLEEVRQSAPAEPRADASLDSS